MSTGGLSAPGGPKKKPAPKKKPVPKKKTPPVKDKAGVGYTPGYKKTPTKNSYSSTAPYSPLGQSFQTQGDLQKAIDLRVLNQLQPILQETDRQREREVRAHAGRQADIESYYGWYDKNLQQATDNLRRSLADISASQNASDANAQNTLRAALTSGLARDSGAADTIAGLSPVNMGISQDQLNSQLTSSAVGQSASNQLAQQALANQQAQDKALNVSGASRLKRMTDETARNVAKIDELDNDRRRAYLRRPALSEAARKELQAEEIQKQNLRFQQKLARDQFGETQKQGAAQRANLNFQQWLAKQQYGLDVEKFLHQKDIDWANVHINETQVQNQAASINAQVKNAEGTANEEVAKEEAAKWAKGLEWMQSFLAPVKGHESLDSPNYKARVTYESMWRQLTQQLGLSRKMALKLLSTVEPDSPTLKYIRNRARNGGHRGVGKIPYLKPEISGKAKI